MGPRRPPRHLFPRRAVLPVALAMGAFGSAACGGGGEVELPPPRPIVIYSGERLRADPARLDSIYAWLTEEVTNIEEDPTFLIEGVPAARESFPWESLVIEGDTARIQFDRAHPDALTPFHIYAHLHLMDRHDRLDEWLPEHATAEGYELERAIVDRVADAWLLGRAAFDAPAFAPLDELIYAREAGYLDAFLLLAQGETFPEEKEAWEAAHPGRMDEYLAWFDETFDREPPGVRDSATLRR